MPQPAKSHLSIAWTQKRWSRTRWEILDQTWRAPVCYWDRPSRRQSDSDRTREPKHSKESEWHN